MRRIVVGTVALGVLLMAGSAWGANFIALHSFTGGTSDGSYPVAALIADPAGNLYGTTRYGGEFGAGTVFELQRSGKTYTEVILYSFQNGDDGDSPAASLVRDKDGNLYGTTRLGGPSNAGIAFELSPSNGTWTETILWAFTGGNDGGAPQSPLTLKGNVLYGTTPEGGPTGNGVVYELQQVNGVWQEQPIYSFAGGSNDGCYPYTGLVFDKHGNMYGTAESCGPNMAGAVFELVKSKKTWTEQILHFFSGNSDGASANGGLVFDKAGNLYGMTQSGGTYTSGTVFELSPSNGSWTEQVIYNFTGGADGGFPGDSVILDNKGNLYGTAFNGGNLGWGTVFELSPSDGGWNQTVLYSFTGGNDGALPLASLLRKGNKLFGVAVEGGSAFEGSAFEIIM
jgi:uncharacterized repeat protein (TIGR03803 family)